MTMRSLVIVGALLAAGCSGGGGSSSAPPLAPGATPTPVPSATPVPNPSSTPSSRHQTAKFVITVPIGRRHRSNPRYVSPNTNSVGILVNSVNGGAPPAWVPSATVFTSLTTAGGTPNCTLGVGNATETCTIVAAAPPGTVNYTISAYDANGVKQGPALSTFTGNVNVPEGSTNTLSVTLNGVPASVTVTGTSLVPDTANASGETLTVAVLDASGAQIVSPGKYANPITLTDNDATLQTSLSLNGAAGASAIEVTDPTDVVTLPYTGQVVNPFTITGAGIGLTTGVVGTIGAASNDIAFTGTTLDTTVVGGLNTDPNYGAQTVFFAQTNGTANFSATELGYTDAPFSQAFDVTLSAGCAGVASTSPGPQTSFTVTALGVGVCSGRLTEHGTGYPITSHPASVVGSPTEDGTFWISVSSASIGVNGKHR